jgi:hypothetical protein
MWFRHANWIDKNNSFYFGSVDIDFFVLSLQLASMNNNIRNITIIIDTYTKETKKNNNSTTCLRHWSSLVQASRRKKTKKKKERERERREEKKRERA